MLRRALAILALVVVADQVTKWWILTQVMQPPRILEVTGFFNLVLVWNRGISFGLLGDGGQSQAWLLAAFGTLVAGGLLVWVQRGALSALATAGAGLVAGGALGNVVDRLQYGAVVDFLDLHLGGWHWPAFNLADSAITVGVILLLLDAVLQERQDRS